MCMEATLLAPTEHMASESSADAFVESIVRHGDTILFSAAIPGQVGQNHLNEQWPDYWQKKFAAYGFYFHDVIRPVIWNNNNVYWWYRQNIFLVQRRRPEGEILLTVHPECYLQQNKILGEHNTRIVSGGLGVKFSITILIRAIMKWFM